MPERSCIDFNFVQTFSTKSESGVFESLMEIEKCFLTESVHFCRDMGIALSYLKKPSPEVQNKSIREEFL